MEAFMNKFKPCPNCGTANITAEGHRPDSTVFCDECGEERTLEEWQDDTAREKILRARLGAAEALIAALEWERECRESLYGLQFAYSPANYELLATTTAATAAVEDAKKKLEESVK